MQLEIKRIQQAITDLKEGRMIILTDNPERENEGDLVCAAEKITPELMNFMIRYGTGIVCLSLGTPLIKKLNLPLMVPNDKNESCRGTPFTVSIDAKFNITTGVSAADRAETILAAVKENASPDDLVRPGHIFPLQAKAGGVLERQGHTEGAVDLAKLAGFQEAAVICELINEDGTMTKGDALTEFAHKHQLTTLSIDELINYRLLHEDLIEEETSSIFHLNSYGKFKISAIREKITGKEHVVLQKETTSEIPLIRIHSSCLTGDLFASCRCDCHQQLHYSLKKISEEGGILIYLNQEGRGIGLFNKIKAYHLQEQGLDTVEANEALGLPIDSRQYFIAAHILKRKKISSIRLLTNNPNKLEDLKRFGIKNIIKEDMPSFQQEHNQFYLRTKNDKLNHSINLDLNIEDIYKVI